MTPANPSPNTPQPSSPDSPASPRYGTLIGDYGDRPNQRYGWIAFAVVSAFLGFIFGAYLGVWGQIVLIVGLPLACLVQIYYGYGARAQIFEHGFIISRSGKTISGQWKDIAKVTHQVQQSRLFGIIPFGRNAHNYVIILTTGERVTIYGTYFSNSQQLGDTITQMVVKAHAAPSA